MSILEPELLKLSKQEIVDLICSLANFEQKYMLGRGSSIPSAFFYALENKFHVPVANGMHGKAAAFCDRFNVEWDASCDSFDSPSGGGGTVTKKGLVKIARAVQIASTVSNY